MIEWQSNTGAVYSSVRQRPYWALRYTDGRIVNEWEVDWSQAPLKGRQRIRLYCPNGDVGEFGDTRDATGQFVQFKVATRGNSGEHLLAHVIGMIHGTDGQVTCAAWEFQADGSGRRVGPWEDNVYRMAYHELGALNADHLGLADGEGR